MRRFTPPEKLMSDVKEVDAASTSPLWSDTLWDGLGEICASAKKMGHALSIQFLDIVKPCNPVTKVRQFHWAPRAAEDCVGNLLFSENSLPHRYQEYVTTAQKVGQQLAQHSSDKTFDFQFTVTNDWNINAWALPGGKVMLTLGLVNALDNEKRDFGGTLPSLEEKMAGVLSHEIIHATARHHGSIAELRMLMAAVIKTNSYVITRVIQKLLNPETPLIQKINNFFDTFARLVTSGLGQCRHLTYELEADKYGVALMEQSGFKTESALWLKSFFTHQRIPSKIYLLNHSS